MTTRDSMNEFVHQAEQAIHNAEEQLMIVKQQEHYNHTEFTNAQMELEQTNQELENMMNNANSQQKERLHRLQLLLEQTQQKMILDTHARYE